MANVLTVEAAKQAKLTLVEDGRGSQAVHDLVVALRANRRSGTACAKTRSEVKESGKKPYRQKGTGRARQGGNAAPLHRGGGVIFGPRPRDYSKTVNRQVRRLAFARVLTEKIQSGDVIVIPEFQVSDGKTKAFVTLVRGLSDRRKVLVIGTFDEMTFRAARNVREVLLMSPEEVNVEQLLHCNHVLVTEDSLGALAKRTDGVQSRKEERK
jgi:large subunit ribosomal protein L4